MIKTTPNASPNLVPIFMFPRNIVLHLSLRKARPGPLGAKALFWGAAAMPLRCRAVEIR